MCLAGWPMPPLSRIIPFCGGTQTHLTSKSYLHQPRVGSRQAARFVYSTATALGFVLPALVSRPHSKGRRQTDQSSYDAPAPISLRIARHDRPHRSFLSHCESPEMARSFRAARRSCWSGSWGRAAERRTQRATLSNGRQTVRQQHANRHRRRGKAFLKEAQTG